MSFTTKALITDRLKQIDEDMLELQRERNLLFESLRIIDEREIEVKIIKRLLPDISDDMLRKYISDLDKIKSVDSDQPKDKKIGPGNLKEMSKDVFEFLKEQGKPTSMHDIAKFLEDKFDYKVSTPSNSMRLMMKHEIRIKRSHRKGFYELR